MSQGTQVRLDVVSEGATQYQPSFILQEDGLAGDGGADNQAYNIVRANCKSVVTGLQTKVPPKDVPLAPALTGVGTRLPGDKLAAFLAKPSDKAVAGGMPAPKLADDDMKALLAYLNSLK